MAKSLFGGSAIVTGALLVGSLIFYAHPSIAEDLAQQNKQAQQEVKTEITGTSVPAEGAPVLADATEVNRTAAPVVIEREPGPPPPELKKATLTAMQQFTATAYSLRGRTSSGLMVARGLIAADRRVLPLGTRIRLEAGAYSGEYLVADHGGAVRGRKIDIWMPSTREAMRFGRRPVRLTVLSYGGARNRARTRR